MHDDYLAKYIEIIRRYTTKDFDEGQLDVSMADLGINSFTVIEIMMVVEETFAVNFPDSLINPDLFLSPQTFFAGLMTVIKAEKIQ